MNIEKEPCKSCGKHVLPSTLEKTSGYCMPCYKALPENKVNPIGPIGKKFIGACFMLVGVGVIGYALYVWDSLGYPHGSKYTPDGRDFSVLLWLAVMGAGGVVVGWIVFRLPQKEWNQF